MENSKCVRCKAHFTSTNNLKTCEKCIEYKAKYRLENAEKIKNYYLKNQQKILKQKQEYYTFERRDVLIENTKCECGCELQRRSLNDHLKSKKHFKNMELSQTS